MREELKESLDILVNALIETLSVKRWTLLTIRGRHLGFVAEGDGGTNVFSNFGAKEGRSAVGGVTL